MLGTSPIHMSISWSHLTTSILDSELNSGKDLFNVHVMTSPAHRPTDHVPGTTVGWGGPGVIARQHEHTPAGAHPMAWHAPWQVHPMASAHPMAWHTPWHVHTPWQVHPMAWHSSHL